MEFAFTPDAARSIAEIVVDYYTERGFKVKIEVALDSDTPYRTTINAESRGLNVLVEAQRHPSYHVSLQNLAMWLSGRRHFCELYIAISQHSDVSGTFLNRLDADGVGLLVVNDDQTVSISRPAKNPALVVSLPPGLSLGRCRAEIEGVVQKYNSGNRKDGLREMCEIVEREADVLIGKAAKKKWIDKDEHTVSKMRMAVQIDVLASNDRYTAGHQPLVSEDLRFDLHSFRTARNLFDHKVRTWRQAIARERQYGERMMMGPRLIHELLSLQRRVR